MDVVVDVILIRIVVVVVDDAQVRHQILSTRASALLESVTDPSLPPVACVVLLTML